MTPQWFTDLALTVVRNMDYGTPFQVHVDALYEAVCENFAARGSHDRSQLFPWLIECDNDMGIEQHRRRYWDVTPYNDQEREAILKRWTPPGESAI